MIPAPLWPDPRDSRAYRTARTLWLAGYRGQLGTCVLCRAPVDCALPGLHPWGPTIEHLLPIRWIRANARTKAECQAMACDTTQWGLAHRRCQAQQGARVVNAARGGRPPTPHPPMVGASRVW